MGTLVDMLCLSESNEVYDKFYISDIQIDPENKVNQIVKAVYDTVIASGEDKDFMDLDMFEDKILSAAEAISYQANWKPETRVKKIIEEGSEYFNMLSLSEGKTIVSRIVYDTAKLISAKIKASEATKHYFINTSEIEVRKHLALKFTYLNVECKAELDLLIINHKTKELLEADIKTTSSEIENFSYEFFKYKYYFQRAFYRLAIIHGLLQQEEFKDYTYLGSHLIVANVNDMRVATFVVPAKYLNSDGFIINGKKYEGVTHAINRLKYHRANEVWEFPMEYYKNDRRLLIKDGYEENS